MVKKLLVGLSLLLILGTMAGKAIIEPPLHETFFQYENRKGKGKRKNWWNR
jgi:hypothetical protein